MKIRLVLAASCIAVIALASADMAAQVAADEVAEPIARAPAPALPESHWRLLERVRTNYIRLPDGRCIDATRLMAVRRIRSAGSAGRWLPNDLRAYGIGDAEPEVLFKYDGLPVWHEPFAGGFLVCSDMPGMGSVRIEHELDPGVLHASIEGALNSGRATVAIRGIQAFHEGGRAVGDFLLWRSGSALHTGIPLYDAHSLDAVIPTAEQLAHAVQTNQAILIVHNVQRREHQPLVRQKKGTLVKTPIVSKAGPREVTYTWTSKPFELGFRDGDETVRVDDGEESGPADVNIETARVDLLFLRDGRQFQGRLIESNDEEVLFLVVVGGIQSEMRFSTSEIDRIDSATQP